MNLKRIFCTCIILLASLTPVYACWCCDKDDATLEGRVAQLNEITPATGIQYTLSEIKELVLKQKGQASCRQKINTTFASKDKVYTMQDYSLWTSYGKYPFDLSKNTSLYLLNLTEWRPQWACETQRGVIVLWNMTDVYVDNSSTNLNLHSFNYSYSFSTFIEKITGGTPDAHDFSEGGYLGYPKVYFSENFPKKMNEQLKILGVEKVLNTGVPLIKKSASQSPVIRKDLDLRSNVFH